MTSKERAALKAQAMKIDSIFQIGKASLSPAQVEAIKSALRARELIKVSVLKNCTDDPAQLAEVIAERTGSQVVQVIGKKIVLYKKNGRKEAGKRPAKTQQKRGTAGTQQKRGPQEGKKGRAFAKTGERAAGRGIARNAGKGNDRLRGSGRGGRTRAARHG